MDTFDRQQLRALIRQRRNSLTAEQQLEAAKDLTAQALSLIGINRRIALYLTNDGEIDTSHLIDTLRDREIELHFPVLHPFCKGYLNFQSVNRLTKWTSNKYGIVEPALNSQSTTILEDINIIFLPLVAFDHSGNRLGMGGGYYDRTLAHVNQLNARPLLVGLAHDCQQVDSLPNQSWDVP